MTRSLPATIALPPSLASTLATRMNLLTSFARLRIAQHEALLVGADGGADDFVRDRQEACIERAHQHDRPFDQPGDFLQQAFVLDQLVALREGEILRVGKDDLGAPRRIEHDLGLLELRDVIVEAPHRERLRRHEAMAARRVAGGDAVDRRTARSRALPSPARRCATIECSGRTQVKHRLRAAPAHRLRPRETRARLRARSRRSRRSPARPFFSMTAT